MKKSLSSSLLYASVILLSVVLSACSALLPAATPTPTLPARVDSRLRPQLLGKWRANSGGPWNNAILTFGPDDTFSVVGGSQEPNATGTFFFTAENIIAFRLPKYQGTAQIEFLDQDTTSLTVTTSLAPFGIIYSIKRVP